MKHSTTEIWEEFSQSLLDFIRKRVNDAADAEDILQDVFIKIHTRIDTLQDGNRLASWLYQITRNTIIDYYRTRRPVLDLPETLAIYPEPVEGEPEAELAAGLRDFMGVLPDPYREAVLLTDLEGLKQSDLADHLGLSLSGAKSRVQRGRQMLREAFLECCHFEFDRRGHLLDYAPRPDCCSVCRK